MPVPGKLEHARAAIKLGDAATARRVLEAVDPVDAAAREALAQVCYLELDFPGAIEGWEAAYPGYHAAGDAVGALRVARTLAYLYVSVVGDDAVAGGWLARARTLLAGRDGLDAGWVALNAGMFDGDRAAKDASFRAALALARRYDDRDLELTALGYLGASLVHDDRTEEGMVLLDEALAALAGGEVDDFLVLEEVFCQLFSACEHAHDVSRAEQWMRVGDTLARRRNLPAVSAFCRTHYGGVLTAAGRFSEADTTLTEAIRLWGLGERSRLRAGAVVRLADLRVRQGRFDEAEQLLADPYVHPNDVALPLAAVHLSRGETALAIDLLERALAHAEPGSSAAAALLALLVDGHLAAGRPADATRAAEELTRCADRHHNVYLSASAALARGKVCLAANSGLEDAQACLRAALQGFTSAQAPMELAHTRLALARAISSTRPEVALVEARAALEAFERLDAARQVDAATALLRSFGVRPSSPRRSNNPLTKRETEVLGLLGAGRSNPEISDQLYISRKTVEHHVANILAKLVLRNRAEAAAYAARTKSGTEWVSSPIR
jgi:DNA-binding NarL/FixJ family response regulator